MTLNACNRFLCTLAAILVLDVCAPAGFATEATAVKSIAAGIPMEQRMEALHKLSQVSCPQGYEYAIPGIYYYCVGIRDIAKGNADRARSMLEIAASWGNKQAQFALGMSYYKGDVQALDRGRGLAWLGLAAERQNPTYVAIFKSAWGQATPEERARGSTLWKSLLPDYGDKRAARRAERRYRNERTRMMANSVYGAVVCMAGTTTGRIDTPGNREMNKSDIDCGAQPVEFVVHKMDAYADDLLDGWVGHVTVGPLQQAPAPSK